MKCSGTMFGCASCATVSASRRNRSSTVFDVIRFRRQHFDRELSLERHIAHEEHDRESARAELALDDVRVPERLLEAPRDFAAVGRGGGIGRHRGLEGAQTRAVSLAAAVTISQFACAMAASTPTPLDEILSLPEFEERARDVMSHMGYEYVASGAADEHTLRWNRERYEEIRLRPRVLVDVGRVNTATTLLGATLPFPILLAPTAYQKAVHPEGELGTARGGRRRRDVHRQHRDQHRDRGHRERRHRAALVSALRAIRPRIHARSRTACRSGRLQGAVPHR